MARLSLACLIAALAAHANADDSGLPPVYIPAPQAQFLPSTAEHNFPDIFKIGAVPPDVASAMAGHPINLEDAPHGLVAPAMSNPETDTSTFAPEFTTPPEQTAAKSATVAKSESTMVCPLSMSGLTMNPPNNYL